MTTASLDLCKELFGCTADIWPEAAFKLDWVYGKKEAHGNVGLYRTTEMGGLWTWWPAYNLEYLLDKLPATLDLGKHTVRDLFIGKFPDGYIADYRYRDSNEINNGGGWWHRYDKANLTEAKTASDAAAKLCIELFKQNILTRKDDL